MIKVACLTDAPEGVIAPTFRDAGYILLMDAETGAVLRALDRGAMSDVDLARFLAEEDCEAVITGPVEKAPFAILADEAFVTRYNGVGLTAPQALERMNAYALPMIIDEIGGDGACNNDEEGHRHHHHRCGT